MEQCTSSLAASKSFGEGTNELASLRPVTLMTFDGDGEPPSGASVRGRFPSALSDIRGDFVIS